MFNMRASTAKGVAILVSLLVTILVSVFGSPTFSELPRPSWQPSNTAFSIWALIYTGVAVGGAFRLVHAAADRESAWSAGLLCVCLVSSAAWLLSVKRVVELSAVFIVVSFLAALVALGVDPPLRDPCNVGDRLASLGPALLTGWLSVAAPLGVNLAVQMRGGQEVTGWAVLPSAATAAVAGGVSGTPEVGAVLIWAALFSDRSVLSGTLGIIGFVSVVMSIVRSVLAANAARCVGMNI